MKKLFLTVAACAAMTFSASAVEAGNANIYASGLKVNGSNLQFVLNAPGDVIINFYNGGVKVEGASIEKKGLSAGENTVSLDGVFKDIAANTELTWEVVATAAANTSIKGFSTYASKVAELSGGDVAYAERENVNAEIWNQAASSVTDDGQKMEYPYSLAVDKCPTSPNFGNIYILNDFRNYFESEEYGNLGFPQPAIERDGGIYVYDSNLNLLNEVPYSNGYNGREGTFSDGNMPIAPYAVAVDDEGFVYVSNNSNSTNGGGVYVAAPNNLSNFEKLITSPAGNCFQDFVVVGTGEDKVLYVLSETKNTILKYEIGKKNYEYQTFIELNPENLASPTSPALAKFSLFPARICSDKKGGFWIIAMDPSYSTDANAWYRLNHVNANGVNDFSTTDYWGNCKTTLDYFKLAKYWNDIDTNEDGSILTIAVCGSIVPLGVTFDEETMKPTLKSPNTSDATSYIYGPYLNSPYGRWGNSMHPVTRGVAYDIAGNIYATDLSGYFQAFALPKAENTYTTPANEAIIVNDTMTGIADVAVDANAPVEYYNLQGVKVENPANGIFVKKQAGKATKVIL